MKRFKVTPDGKLRRITAAVEDEIEDIRIEDDYNSRDIDIDDGFADKLDDVVDTVEDIQNTVDSEDIREEDVSIDIDNNISGHYIAECDRCKGIFISATILSDQVVESVKGECPLCGEETEQFLKWVVEAVSEIER